jgi:hypothetical protein
MTERSDYPMNRIQFQTFPLCGARNRQGEPCRAPAMKGKKRCRLHGGKSLSGKAHGRYKHGHWTKESIEERRRFSELLKEARRLLVET